MLRPDNRSDQIKEKMLQDMKSSCKQHKHTMSPKDQGKMLIRKRSRSEIYEKSCSSSSSMSSSISRNSSEMFSRNRKKKKFSITKRKRKKKDKRKKKKKDKRLDKKIKSKSKSSLRRTSVVGTVLKSDSEEGGSFDKERKSLNWISDSVNTPNSRDEGAKTGILFFILLFLYIYLYISIFDI